VEDFGSEWVAALDRLELDVGLAEQMLAERRTLELPLWRTPTMHAPMPEDLVPRARLIHERQLAVVHALTRRATATSGQLALTSKMRSLIHPDIPVYVDLSA